MTQAIRPAFINCIQCGEQSPVADDGPVPKYCSPACRSRYNKTKAQTTGQAAEWERRRLARQAEASAERAAQRRATAKPCPYCSAPMENPRRVQCGAPDCKRQYANERQRDFQRKHRAETGKRYSSQYRERELEYYKRRRETQPHWRKRYPEIAALSDARRRALIEQAFQGEVFAPKYVYERDHWTCGLCRLPVDPELPWPHPMSASMDHIVPLSRGGEHSLANVQCAHLSCNSRKCDQTIEEINQVEAKTVAINGEN